MAGAGAGNGDKPSPGAGNSRRRESRSFPVLNDCKRYNYLELKSLIAKSTDPLSILFKNIDGVASNFDSFSSELLVNNSNISIVTLAETNLDECNKNLYNLPSFQCECQSKISGKSKGSGLAIYVKENFLYTRKEEFCQTTPNLESLFISINNTEVTTYVGVVYRPPILMETQKRLYLN